MYLVSVTWGEYKKRYTGIHGFNVMDGVKPLSGVNMDDDKWNTLTFNFLCVKDVLNGKKDACVGLNPLSSTIYGNHLGAIVKGLFVRECAEGSRCSRKTLCVCVWGKVLASGERGFQE